MVFSISKNEEETCRKFIELRKRIIQIKNKNGLPETDGRVQILNNLAWATASIISRLNVILILNQQPKSHPLVAQLIGLGKVDAKTGKLTNILEGDYKVDVLKIIPNSILTTL